MPEVLADQENYQITFHASLNGATRPLVISFGSQPNGKSSSGFGTSFLLNSGYDTIYVSQKLGTQYQGLSLEQFYSAVKNKVDGRDVVTYGASLGGYAALYYGGCINARIIAAAPRQSSWPPLEHPKWSKIDFVHEELWQATTSKNSTTVFYDTKLAKDSKMVDEMVLRAYPEARLVKSEYTGHVVLKPFQNAGILKNLIRSLIDSDIVISFELPTENCPEWTLNKGRDLIKKTPVEGRRLLNQSFHLLPNRRSYESLLVSLVREGLIDDARVLIQDCVRLTGSRIKVNKGILDLLEKHGLNRE